MSTKEQTNQQNLAGISIAIAASLILHFGKKVIDFFMGGKKVRKIEEEKNKGYKKRMEIKYDSMERYDEAKEKLRREAKEYDESQKVARDCVEISKSHSLRNPKQENPEALYLGERNEIDSPQLLGKWLYAGNIAVLHGRSNIGKSFMIGQMAIDLAKKGQRVFMYDIEGGGRQFEQRYSMIKSEEYSRNILNVSPISTLDSLLESICSVIERCSTDMTIFIDNITAIAPYNDTQRQLMDEVRYIRDNAREQLDKFVTFVLVAHPAKDGSDKKIEIWKIENISVRGDGSQVSLADKVISLDTTNLGDGMLRLALPKTRTSKVDDVVSVIKIADPTEDIPYIHIKHICDMHDKDTIKANAKLPILSEQTSGPVLIPRKQGATWEPTSEAMDKIIKMRNEGISWDKIGKEFGVDRKTIQKYYSRYATDNLHPDENKTSIRGVA